MKLNHLHLMVTDVRSASTFLERYFGLQNNGGNDGLTVLIDDDGLVLTLMKIGSTSNNKYPDNFHIGDCILGSNLLGVATWRDTWLALERH